jgi:hypothetical protein
MSTAEGGANIVRNGLVLYLDGSNYKSIVSGDTTWNDIEKFPSYNMTLTNGAAYENINKGSVRFDGTDDYAVRPYVSGDLYDINITSAITVDVWVRFDDVLDIYGSVISFGRPYGNRTAGHFQWELIKLNTNYPSTGGECRIFFAISNLAETVAVNQITNDGNFNPSTPPPQDNVWMNLTYTYIYSPESLVAYYNGENAGGAYTGALTSPPQIPAIAYQDLNIGAASDLGGSFAMAGNIASVKIYNRVLTPQEVAQNYNALKPRFSY